MPVCRYDDILTSYDAWDKSVLDPIFAAVISRRSASAIRRIDVDGEQPREPAPAGE